jgi:hypothetical protein
LPANKKKQSGFARKKDFFLKTCKHAAKNKESESLKKENFFFTHLQKCKKKIRLRLFQQSII